MRIILIAILALPFITFAKEEKRMPQQTGNMGTLAFSGKMKNLKLDGRLEITPSDNDYPSALMITGSAAKFLFEKMTAAITATPNRREGKTLTCFKLKAGAKTAYQCQASVAIDTGEIVSDQ